MTETVWPEIDASTPDPEGGEILRDADGEPTGILIDNAEDLITDPETTPGVTIKFDEMIHRIHSGHGLPTIEATAEVVLAHVKTGDAALDRVAEAGLRGLSRILYERTSIEPAEPIMVDLETDELAFFPILYWPITPSQPIPSAEAYAKLNTYLRSGGMIVFDTRDADVSRFGGGSAEARRLQAEAVEERLVVEDPRLDHVEADAVVPPVRRGFAAADRLVAEHVPPLPDAREIC